MRKIREGAIKLFRTKQISQRLKNLLRDISSLTRDQAFEQLTNIDIDMDQIMLSTTPNKQKAHPYWWSPEIHQAHLCVVFWKITQTSRRLSVNMETQLHQLQLSMGKDFDTHQGDTTQSVSAQLRKAIKTRKNLQANSYEIRQNFLLQLSINTEDDDPSRSKRLKQIKTSESLLKTYKKLQRYLKPGQTQGISFLEVDKEGRQEKIVVPEEINKELIHHHQQHFEQAKGTPFTKMPLTTLFGENTETKFSEDFRNGETTILPTEDEFLNTFLTILTPHILDPPKIDDTITLEQVKHGFRNWKESTSTSPKGRILTLYKLWLTKDAQNDKDFHSDDFIQALLDIINISKLLQLPLTRWETVHNIFIRKDQNNSNVKRLRAIHKIDAELNLIRRELIAKRLLRHAETYNFIPENNFGGRNGKTANDVVIHKHFTLQALHLHRKMELSLIAMPLLVMTESSQCFYTYATVKLVYLT